MGDPHSSSLADLIASLAADIPDLLGKEVRLAKAEARRALDLVLVALGRLALGSVIGIGAVGIALATLVSALSVVLVSRGMDAPLAGAVAAAIVTLVAALIAAALIYSAARTLRAAQATLDSTISTVTQSTAHMADKF